MGMKGAVDGMISYEGSERDGLYWTFLGERTVGGSSIL